MQLNDQGKAAPFDAPHKANGDHIEAAEDHEAYWELDEATDPDLPE